MPSLERIGDRDFATRMNRGAIAKLYGILPDPNDERPHRSMKVSDTDVCLCSLVGDSVAKDAVDCAKKQNGAVVITPCRNQRIVVYVECGKTYTVIFDGEAIPEAPSLEMFRPGPPASQLEIYKQPFSKRTDGRFRTH